MKIFSPPDDFTLLGTFNKTTKKILRGWRKRGLRYVVYNRKTDKVIMRAKTYKFLLAATLRSSDYKIICL